MTNFGDVSGSAARMSSMMTSTSGEEGLEDLEGGVPKEQGGPGKGDASESTKGQAAANSMTSSGIEKPGEVDGKEEVEGGSGIEGGEGEIEGGEGEIEPPYVPPPLVEPAKISTVTDLSTLMGSLQLTEQKKNAEKTVNEIKSQNKEQQVKFQEQIKKIEDNIAESKKNSILKVFQKVFAVIGAILGAIGGALAIAAGAASGNPLLVAAGVMAIVASIDAAMSSLSDGKVSISAGITKALEAMGVPAETAQWIAFGVQLAMIALTIAVGFASGGGGAMAGVSKIADMFSKAQDVAKMAQMIEKASKIVQIAGSVNQSAIGGTGIGTAVVQSNIKVNEAEQKEIESAITKVKAKIELLQDFFKNQMEQFNAIMKIVTDIIQDSVNTKIAVQRGARE